MPKENTRKSISAFVAEPCFIVEHNNFRLTVDAMIQIG